MSTLSGLLSPGGRPRPLVVCGPSGAGKSTLVKRLMEEFPSTFGFSVSHTTRKPREGEVDGVDYHFVDVEAMEAAIERNEFIEHARVHSNLYGTSKSSVDAVADRGQICILDIDVQGVQTCQTQSLPVSKYIWIAPPSTEELERRLRGRGTETEESIRTRLTNATKEMELSKTIRFDEKLVNDDLDTTYSTLRELIKPAIDSLRRLPIGEAAGAGAAATTE